MYDVAIIGAGPAGLFCALVLTKSTDIKVVIIDEGNSFEKKSCPFINYFHCAKCKSCSTLSGFGGAAFFNPGKLSLYPAGSGLQAILGGEKRCKQMYSDVINIMVEHGIEISNNYEISRIPDVPIDDSIRIKYYNSHPVTRSKMNQFATSVQRVLSNRAVLKMNSRVTSIQKNDQWEMLLEDGNIIKARNIAIGTGESGFRWWDMIADQIGVRRYHSKLDIGIRIEFPPNQLEKYWPYHKDLKILTTAPDGSELRTYCVLKNGIVVPCYYGDYTVLDGICDDASMYAGMTIFNRVDNSFLGVDKVRYVDRYLKSFYTINTNPQSCSALQFLNTDIWKQFAFDERLYTNLKFGLQTVSKYLGIDYKLISKVHVPVIDNLWEKCEVNEYFETTANGIYIMGDATGLARGIMQAAVTGVTVAYGILRSVER